MDAVILQEEALQLPERDRALLADKLLASLSPTSPEIEQAWIRETNDRLDAFRQGQIQAVDGEEAMADLKARFRR